MQVATPDSHRRPLVTVKAFFEFGHKPPTPAYSVTVFPVTIDQFWLQLTTHCHLYVSACKKLCSRRPTITTAQNTAKRPIISDVTRRSRASMRNDFELAVPAVFLGLLLLCCSAGASPVATQSASTIAVEHAGVQSPSSLHTNDAEDRVRPGFSGAEKLPVSNNHL